MIRLALPTPRHTVSFSHTVKSSAPAYMVAANLMMGNSFPPLVYLSMLPILAGVLLSSLSELSFTMFGFLAASASNVAFVARDLGSKRAMAGGSEGKVAGGEMYGRLCWIAFWICLLTAIVTEGSGLMAHLADNPMPTELMLTMTVVGVTHYLYSLSGMLLLEQVAPLTHSLLNVLRRFLVILVSLVLAGRVPPLLNALGMLLVFIGVGTYSYAKSGAASASGSSSKAKAAPTRRVTRSMTPKKGKKSKAE